MKLIPVALAIFHRRVAPDVLEVWVQTRTDTGIYHGLLEFPGGGIEAGETPLMAAVREVEEEVGIKISPDDSRFMGVYTNELQGKSILLYVFLFPESHELIGKGEWLRIESPALSEAYRGKIPGPNHRIINDLFSLDMEVVI